ncbi:hypothetical protein [Streptomyces sp. NPDC059783]|uniref:hypothetical protein n=1 Tax=Streptomyces sp. NPDC059783 TaxID=3346944 RepID=UPI003665FEA5
MRSALRRGGRDPAQLVGDQERGGGQEVQYGGLGQTIGWHRFDHEHHAAATRYWHADVHAAHQAGDTDMGAGAISDIAYQNIRLGQPRAATEGLEHALSRTTNPTARSLLFLRKARAHAMLQEPRACYHDLAQAEKSLNSATDDAPRWCAWMSNAVVRSVNLSQRRGVSQLIYVLAS